MTDQNFWDNPVEAQSTIQRAKIIKDWLEPFQEIKHRSNDAIEICTEALRSEDSSCISDLTAEIQLLDNKLSALEMKKMLSGEFDDKNCFLTINAGAGGTESCDWVEILLRMYLKWIQKKQWEAVEIDQLPGTVAGKKHVTLKVSGPFAYGYLKAEKGVHRLVRISPFDSNGRRHTSFASVEITPEIDDTINVDLNPDDLKIDVYRASGAGGQHVNTTESAVRVTHKPTGIVVTCQKERSQWQNKEMCLKILRSKLYQKKREDFTQTLHKIQGDKKINAWSSQKRNYVLQPYTSVKDVETEYEETNATKVLDGEIDEFIHAYLRKFQ